MAIFSERLGLQEPKSIQLDEMDLDLRHSLWNACKGLFVDNKNTVLRHTSFYPLAVALYGRFYKLPVDELPFVSDHFVSQQIEFFKGASWYKVYEFVEFVVPIGKAKFSNFDEILNSILERERSGYRLLAGVFVPVTSREEISEIDKAIAHQDRFSPISTHIRAALELYGKKPSPDYRNSIKESISAVESAAKLIVGLDKATLDQALKKISEARPIHTAFKEGVRKLYGYTSDEGGIRHSLTEESNVDDADARFMLVSCSAFANYLVAKAKSL
jgi:hypothetical protein